MKFKIGDRVKVIDGSRKGCIGKIVHIREGYNSPYPYGIKTDRIGNNDAGSENWAKDITNRNIIEKDSSLKLISSKKMANKKVKYILKYDLQSAEDPYEEFATLDEVKKRIEELITNNEGIIMSSVRVYEVKSVAKVETKIEFN